MVGPSGRFSNFPWLGDPLRLLFSVLLRPERQSIRLVGSKTPRSGWSRCLLSCRALATPTTCRFIPALSVLPTNHPVSALVSQTPFLTNFQPESVLSRVANPTTRPGLNLRRKILFPTADTALENCLPLSTRTKYSGMSRWRMEQGSVLWWVQQSIQPSPHSSDCIPVHYAVELLCLLNHREEQLQWHRTIGGHNRHRSGAIRVDGIRAASGCPIGPLLLASDDGVLDPRQVTVAIEVHHAR